MPMNPTWKPSGEALMRKPTWASNELIIVFEKGIFNSRSGRYLHMGADKVQVQLEYHVK
jgi:hypothetical protein